MTKRPTLLTSSSVLLLVPGLNILFGVLMIEALDGGDDFKEPIVEEVEGIGVDLALVAPRNAVRYSRRFASAIVIGSILNWYL